MRLGTSLAIDRQTALGAGGGGVFSPADLPNLFGWWKYNEASGIWVLDYSAGTPTTPTSLIAFPNTITGTGTSPPWADMFGGATRTNAAGTDPNGKTTAARLQFTATGSKAIRYVPGGTLLTNGQTYTLACWVKSNTGLDQAVRLFSTGPAYSSDKAVANASGWVFVSHTFTAGAASSYVGIANDAAASAIDVLVWGVTLVTGSTPLSFTAGLKHLTFQGGTSAPAWSALGLTLDGVDDALGVDFDALVLTGGTIVVACKRAARPYTLNQWWYGSLFGDPTEGITSQTLNASLGGSPNNGNRGGPSGSYASLNAANDINLSAQDGVMDGTHHVLAVSHDKSTFTIMIDGHVLAQKASVKGDTTLLRAAVGFFNGGIYTKGTVCYKVAYSSGKTETELRNLTNYVLSECGSRPGWLAPPLTDLTCTEGDSIMDAVQSFLRYGWPRAMDEYCHAPVGEQSRPFAVVGSHVGPYPSSPGDTNHWITRGPAIDAMKRPGVTVRLIAQGAANDASDTAIAVTKANLQTYYAARHAAGLLVYLVEMIPKLSDGGVSDAFRDAYNAYLNDVANIGLIQDAAPCRLSLCDAVGPHTTAANPFWFNPDEIHPLDAYYFFTGPIMGQWYQGLRGRMVTAILTDTFTDQNGPLQNHWPDYAAGGWSLVVGAMSVASNQVTCGTAPALFVAGAGRADYTYSVSLVAGADNAQVFVRWTHPDNYYMVNVLAGAIQIWEVVAGTATLKATSVPTAGSLPLTLQVVTNGASITASVGGTSVNYASATLKQNSTGFGLRAATTAAVFDTATVVA